MEKYNLIIAMFFVVKNIQ